MSVAVNKHLEQFLKLPVVISMVGKSRSAIYLAIKKNEFPAPVKISGPGGRAVAWTSSSISKWQESCVSASKAAD